MSELEDLKNEISNLIKIVEEMKERLPPSRQEYMDNRRRGRRDADINLPIPKTLEDAKTLFSQKVIDQDGFERILKEDSIQCVFVHSSTCGLCKVIMKEIATDYTAVLNSDSFSVINASTKVYADFKKATKITGTPSLVIFKNGRVLKEARGEAIIRLINELSRDG